MKTAVIALTKNATELALQIGYNMNADIYAKDQIIQKYVLNNQVCFLYPFTVDFSSLVEKLFYSYDSLVFVMACGIVVRSIAPYIRNKTSDPAVVVVDEMGRYAISLLSGHMGGANRLAAQVAGITGGVPVITTATDVNGVIAFDMFALDNNCVIENFEDLKYISGELVNGGKVYLRTDCNLSGVLPSNVVCNNQSGECRYQVVVTNKMNFVDEGFKSLFIRPKNLILGIGCKKGTANEAIQNAVEDFMNKNNRSILSVKQVASIDLKAAEKGILEFCNNKNIEFVTFSAEEIKNTEGDFTQSDFVRKTVGVGSVAEVCAVLGGQNARLICPKTVYKGITLALAEEDRVLYI